MDISREMPQHVFTLSHLGMLARKASTLVVISHWDWIQLALSHHLVLRLSKRWPIPSIDICQLLQVDGISNNQAYYVSFGVINRHPIILWFYLTLMDNCHPTSLMPWIMPTMSKKTAASSGVSERYSIIWWFELSVTCLDGHLPMQRFLHVNRISNEQQCTFFWGYQQRFIHPSRASSSSNVPFLWKMAISILFGWLSLRQRSWVLAFWMWSFIIVCHWLCKYCMITSKFND